MKGMLNNPLVRNLIKTQLPSLVEGIGTMEPAAIDFIKSYQLEEGETHTVLFTEIQDEKLYLCIGAFAGKEFVRLIDAKPAVQFIQNLLQKI